MNLAKTVVLASLLLLSFFNPIAAQAKETSTSASQLKEQKTYLDQLVRSVKHCEGEYSLFLGFVKLSGYGDEPDHVTPYHKICIEKEKNRLAPQAKDFVKSFKNATVQKNARDTVAQWMTTIDSIGEADGKEERTKFQTMANGLLLDL